jgi:heme/copper-type cytochrome/quinol oxidase subunit 2
MKTRRILIPVLVILVIAAVAVVVYVSMNPVDTTLEFEVRDAVSKGWIWDATFSVENRVIRSHFQSDRGPLPQVFTHLEPGEATLEIKARSYVSQTLTVNLKRGENRLAEPIGLVGYEIPDLTKWIIFEDRVGNDLVQEIRPVSSEGPAVLNHPCLDLWIGARISVQVYNGLPAQEETEEGSERGEELYKGILDWEWDGVPETTFRYSSFIPGSQITANNDPYWVIDYLIVVPDPREITREELDQIMEKAWDLPPTAIQTYLEPYAEEGKLTPYLFTSWNVEGASS